MENKRFTYLEKILNSYKENIDKHSFQVPSKVG